MITFSYRGALVIVPFSKAKSSVSSRKMRLIGCYVTGGRTSVWLSWDRETATLRDRHFPHCREGRSFYGICNQSGTEARKRKKTWLGRQSAGSVLTVGSIAPDRYQVLPGKGYWMPEHFCVFGREAWGDDRIIKKVRGLGGVIMLL